MLGFAQRSSYVVTDLNSCNCFSEGLDFFLGIRHRAVGRGKSHDLRVPAYPTPCPPHSVTMSHTWGVADLSHRSQSPPTVLSACDIPKWLGPAGLAKNAAWTKINLPHSLAAPCPFPLSSHPSSLQSLPGKAKRAGERERAGWRKCCGSPTLRKRGRGEERKRKKERDHLIWERAQTMCGNGSEGSRGQIPDRWKKLNMGRSVFLGPENSSCFTASSHKTWPVFLFCLSQARCVS